ncbi:MAG: hypothetical protein ABIO71_11305 [Caldimonas sp.]
MSGLAVPAPAVAPAAANQLEDRLADVESGLAALGNALRARDAAGIERHAGELHRALASAIVHFSDAARSGRVPPALRSRLATASGQVAAQRESLARATAALDRAIDVLLPREGVPLYSAFGSTDRGMFKSGVIQA